MGKARVVLLTPLTVLLFFIGVSLVHATLIQGSLYDGNLDPVVGVLLEMRNERTGVQEQQVAQSTTYQFDVPGGDYVLRASQVEQGKIVAIAQERLRVPTQGIVMLDLIVMAPPEDTGENLTDSVLALDDISSLPLDEPEITVTPTPTNAVMIALGLSFLLIVLLAVWYFWKRAVSPQPMMMEKQNEKQNTIVEPAVEFGKEVLEYLRNHNHRATQKELRKEFPRSEASMSALLSELESAGKIRKERQGRENYIWLRE